MPEASKKCPFCAEDIKADAVKCRHCGSFLPQGEIGRGKIVCRRCGYHGRPRIDAEGSMAAEILLWLCFVVPGLIYSVWRLSNRYKACPRCGGRDIVG